MNSAAQPSTKLGTPSEPHESPGTLANIFGIARKRALGSAAKLLSRASPWESADDVTLGSEINNERGGAGRNIHLENPGSNVNKSSILRIVIATSILIRGALIEKAPIALAHRAKGADE